MMLLEEAGWIYRYFKTVTKVNHEKQACSSIFMEWFKSILPAVHLAFGMMQKALTTLLTLPAGICTCPCPPSLLVLFSALGMNRGTCLACHCPGRQSSHGVCGFRHGGVMELRPRLGAPDASADTWCPTCEWSLDRCSLHTSLRHFLASWAGRAGLQSQVEKPSLLSPQRPPCLSDTPALGRDGPVAARVPCLGLGRAARPCSCFSIYS